MDYTEEDICKIQLDESDEAINKNELEREGLISGIEDGIKNCDYFHRQVGQRNILKAAKTILIPTSGRC